MAGAVRVVIVDDHESLRDALVRLLDLDSSVDVVGVAGDGSELEPLCEELRPDVALVDYMMPKVDGAEATRRVKKRFPEIGIIIYSVLSQEHHVRQGLEAGADRYITKGTPREELVAVIRGVAKEMSELATHREREPAAEDGGW